MHIWWYIQCYRWQVAKNLPCKPAVEPYWLLCHHGGHLFANCLWRFSNNTPRHGHHLTTLHKSHHIKCNTLQHVNQSRCQNPAQAFYMSLVSNSSMTLICMYYVGMFADLNSKYEITIVIACFVLHWKPSKIMVLIYRSQE